MSDENPVFETKSGKREMDLVSIPDTKDLVTLMNLNEWGCKNCNGASMFKTNSKFDAWWLKDCGEAGKTHKFLDNMTINDYYISFVDDDGMIDFVGTTGSRCAFGIRPLIHVKK